MELLINSESNLINYPLEVIHYLKEDVILLHIERESDILSKRVFGATPLHHDNIGDIEYCIIQVSLNKDIESKVLMALDFKFNLICDFGDIDYSLLCDAYKVLVVENYLPFITGLNSLIGDRSKYLYTKTVLSNYETIKPEESFSQNIGSDRNFVMDFSSYFSISENNNLGLDYKRVVSKIAKVSEDLFLYRILARGNKDSGYVLFKSKGVGDTVQILNILDSEWNLVGDGPVTQEFIDLILKSSEASTLGILPKGSKVLPKIWNKCSEEMLRYICSIFNPPVIAWTNGDLDIPYQRSLEVFPEPLSVEYKASYKVGVRVVLEQYDLGGVVKYERKTVLTSDTSLHYSPEETWGGYNLYEISDIDLATLTENSRILVKLEKVTDEMREALPSDYSLDYVAVTDSNFQVLTY